MVAEPKLLLISEDLDYLRTLEEALTSQTYAVKIANDGQEAVNVAAEYKPELILVDLDFKARDEGFKTCMILRRITDSPMIVMSGNHDELEKIKYLNLCADRFIDKPCRPDILLSTIHSLLRLWLYHHQR